MRKRPIEDSETSEIKASNSTIEFSEIEDLNTSLYNDYEDEEKEFMNAASLIEDEAHSYQDDVIDNSLINKALGRNYTLDSDASCQDLMKDIMKAINESEKYIQAIKAMCTENRGSIGIDYNDFHEKFKCMEDDPHKFLNVLSKALTSVVKIYYPSYSLIKPTIHGRIVNLPVVENIRDLRNNHINKLVRVYGIVTRRSGVFSEYSVVHYMCMRCKASFGPFYMSGGGKDGYKEKVQKPTTCFECQGGGPFLVDSNETVYKDFQRVTIQDIPGMTPSGSLPRSKEIILTYDLIDSCKPGDEVDVTGIYRNSYSINANARNGFPVFSTLIECSSVVKKINKLEMTNEDIKEIKALGKNPNIIDWLIDSVAPGIYGHRNEKICILLSMVGGEAKYKDEMRIRGDINVLLMGDPGTAKSQFLRVVHQTSHRAVLANGQGASSVGLTASVRKDTALREWVLEGGALVIADNGVCCIDEFDKMNDSDRVAIHEAMEQQSITVAKAGIIASLHARCGVIAAANPARGRYNSALSFGQNINLSDPIISRFDLLCVVKDVIDEAEDKKMAEFILKSHHGDKRSDALKIESEILKKYILYARSNVHPLIVKIESSKISNLYKDLRRESVGSGVPITVRHVESIIRISEAFAKLRLSSVVQKEDIDMAISLTLNSFLSAQKYSVSKHLRRKFAKYLEENNDELAVYLLKRMFVEVFEALGTREIFKKEFIGRCKNSGVSVSEKFFICEKFKEAGFSLNNDKIVRNV